MRRWHINSLDRAVTPVNSPLDGCRRTLVARLDNVGDVVLLGPALRAIRAVAPRAHLGLLASPAGATAAGVLPEIDEVIVARVPWQDASATPVFDPAAERLFIDRLASGRWDAILIFTSFSQTPFPAAYAAYLAGIPIRAGQASEFGGAMLTHQVAPAPWEAHQAERNLRLVEGLGVPVEDRSLSIRIPSAARSSVDALLAGQGVRPDEPTVVVAPGASCEARRYAPDRYAAAGRELSRATGARLVVVGSAKEANLIAPIVDAVSGAVSLVGRTTLPEFAALVERAALVVCGNSAALHLADALRRPVVVLYSGTDLESQWQPRHTASVVLRRETNCHPCYRFDCPFDMECLDIAPADVVAAGLRLLEVEGQTVEEEPCAVSAS